MKGQQNVTVTIGFRSFHKPFCGGDLSYKVQQIRSHRLRKLRKKDLP